MSRWSEFVAKLLAAAQQGLQKPVRPRVVDDALAQQYDLDAYHRAHGGDASPDAPHIPDDGTI